MVLIDAALHLAQGLLDASDALVHLLEQPLKARETVLDILQPALNPVLNCAEIFFCHHLSS